MAFMTTCRCLVLKALPPFVEEISLSCYRVTEVLFMVTVVDSPSRFAVAKVFTCFAAYHLSPIHALPTVVRCRHKGLLAVMFLVV